MRLGLRKKKGASGIWHIDENVYVDGHERRKRETFKGTREEAEARCIEIRNALRLRTSPEPVKKNEPLTFGMLLESYRIHRKVYKNKVVDVVRFNTLMRDLGTVPLESLPLKMDEYLHLLKKDISKKTGKVLSNGSRNRLLAMTNAALNLAVNSGDLKKNPLPKAKFGFLPEVSRKNTLTDDQKNHLLDVISKRAPYLLPITQFALRVPSRKSELTNMKIEDLHIDDGYIRVKNSKAGIGINKPIPTEMIDYFRSIPKDCKYLFYREEKGRYYPLNCFYKAWLNCLEDAGLDGIFRFHDTRRIAATEMVNYGNPDQVVAAVAGWKSTAMLTRYYTVENAWRVAKLKPITINTTVEHDGSKVEV